MKFLNLVRNDYPRLALFKELEQKTKCNICFIKKITLILLNYFRPHCYTAA